MRAIQYDLGDKGQKILKWSKWQRSQNINGELLRVWSKEELKLMSVKTIKLYINVTNKSKDFYLLLLNCL